ncbi:hypothetical protein [Nocardioides marmoriginsengisoli]|nr:hypothetical protein [Nocardioides marmoriginsengisoli]
MTPPLVLPRATAGGSRHPGCSYLPVLGLNAILGIPAYLFSFLFAYAFVDVIGWTQHLTFLGLIAVYAFVVGSLATSVPAWRYPESSFRILNFGVVASLALNTAAVGIGSIASAANKDQQSVSAAFSTTTDVLVAMSLFGVAAICAFAASRIGSIA